MICDTSRHRLVVSVYFTSTGITAFNFRYSFEIAKCCFDTPKASSTKKALFSLGSTFIIVRLNKINNFTSSISVGKIAFQNFHHRLFVDFCGEFCALFLKHLNNLN